MLCVSHKQTVLTLAALRVVGAQAEEAGLALVAARALDVGLATALTAHRAKGGVGVAVAHPSILRAIGVAVTSCGTDGLQVSFDAQGGHKHSLHQMPSIVILRCSLGTQTHTYLCRLVGP